MAFLIPITREVDDTGAFEQQATLDGVTYTLKFRWNVRGEFWTMHVLDAEGVRAYRVGLVLRVNSPMDLYARDAERLPPGIFVAVDTAGDPDEGQDPGFDDLGSRVQIEYQNAEDFA